MRKNLPGMENRERPFTDKTSKPTNDSLKRALGLAFSYYDQLMATTSSFTREWGYSKTGGWMLKVFDSKKALLYITPLAHSFVVSLTVREKEREILLKDQDIDFHRQQLRNAKRFSEGYAMRFPVTDKESFSRTMQFTRKIIASRK
ncbi:MAG: DUF3788 family protein [Bacteroidota bacterium]|jgi:hypothetical protein